MSTGASQIDVEVVREALSILGIGGGGLGAYLLATRNLSNQTLRLNVNDHIEFDTVDAVDASGDISIATGAGDATDGIITLAANHTYRLLSGTGGGFGGSNGDITVSHFNVTAGSRFGSRGGVTSITDSSALGIQQTAVGIIEVGVSPIEVEVRIIFETFLTSIFGFQDNFGQAFVEVLEIA